MSGKKANEKTADLAVDLYRRMLKRLREPEPIEYRGKPGLEIGN